MRRMFPKRGTFPFGAYKAPLFVLSGEGKRDPHTRDKRMSLVCGSLFLCGEGWKDQEGKRSMRLFFPLGA